MFVVRFILFSFFLGIIPWGCGECDYVEDYTYYPEYLEINLVGSNPNSDNIHGIYLGDTLRLDCEINLSTVNVLNNFTPMFNMAYARNCGESESKGLKPMVDTIVLYSAYDFKGVKPFSPLNEFISSFTYGKSKQKTTNNLLELISYLNDPKTTDFTFSAYLVKNKNEIFDINLRMVIHFRSKYLPKDIPKFHWE